MISGFSSARDRLFKAIAEERAKATGQAVADLPLPDWRLHDFRRTGVTALARLGFPPHVADRLLNHVHGSGAIGGVMAVYQRHEFLAERETALRVWGEHVLAVAEERTAPDNVVALRPG